MQAFVPEYHVKSPQNLSEALKLLSSVGVETWKPIAGGTDLMVLFEAGKLPEGRYLNILGLKELKGITVTPNEIQVGALASYSDIRKNPELTLEFPLLNVAARETGAIAIQNRGTIGGNIANASPAADTPPALLCYDAKLELISSKGSRLVEYSKFHLDYKKTELRSGELISKVLLPRHAGQQDWHHYYRKVGTRKAQAISKVCFCGLSQRNEKGELSHVRIALGSVAAIPIRALATENALLGTKATDATALARATYALSQEISPISDIRSSKDYRLTVALNLLQEFFERS